MGVERGSGQNAGAANRADILRHRPEQPACGEGKTDGRCGYIILSCARWVAHDAWCSPQDR